MRRDTTRARTIKIAALFALVAGGYGALETAYDISLQPSFGLSIISIRPDGKSTPPAPDARTITAALTQAVTGLEKRLRREQEAGRIGADDAQAIIAAAYAYAAAPPDALRAILRKAMADNTAYDEERRDFVTDANEVARAAADAFRDHFSPALTDWLQEDIAREHGCAMRSTIKGGLWGNYRSPAVAFPEKISCDGGTVKTMALAADPAGIVKNIDFAEGKIFYIIDTGGKDNRRPALTFESLSALAPARLEKLFERKAEIEAMLAQEPLKHRQSFERTARAKIMDEIAAARPQGPAP